MLQEGIGQLYKYTTNPSCATGDAIAICYRGGARIVNMEYTQFHPTTLKAKNANNFLISEALRGEGAVLINHRGEEFVNHPAGSLAPRDIVSRSIVEELEQSQKDCVYLSLNKLSIDKFKNHFPNIAAVCESFKIDVRNEPIPVLPAFHFSCGGVLTDIYGRTTLPNLYVIGEAACNGLHGSNRLASTSLLECVVMGANSILNDENLFAISRHLSKIKAWGRFRSHRVSRSFIDTTRLGNFKINHVELCWHRS